jgi:hypothetical protein
MTLLEELEEFVSLHRPHGAPVPDAGTPTLNGYMLTLACPCGVTFMRWVTPDSRCGELDTGMTGEPARVWVTCTCGARIEARAEEDQV